MTGLPRAVQQQHDRAQELMRQSDATQPAGVHNPNGVVHNPDLRPQAASPAPQLPPDQGAQPQPTPQPQHQAHETNAGAPSPESLSQDQLVHRVKTLEGMLRSEADRAKRAASERDRSQGMVQSLSDLVTSLQNQVTTLHQRVDSGQTGQDTPTLPKKPDGLDPEDFEGYGEEMQAMVAKVNALAHENQELRNKYGEVDQRFNQVQQTTAQQGFYRDLNQGAPDWPQINGREDWKAWLLSPEARPRPGEVMGAIRQQILEGAYRRGDGMRVVQMINDWKTDMGFAGNVPGANPDNGLEGQIMPMGGAGASPSPGGPGPQNRPVTLQDFQNAQRAMMSGKITNDEFQKVLAGYQRTVTQAGAGA